MASSSNHHLIPRVYLRSWICSGDTIYAIDKNTKKVTPHNVERICSINDYHSIKAGMPCSKIDDLKYIFEILQDYVVVYNERNISKYEDYNKYYYDFNNWNILKKDGKLASKKMIKAEINY